MGNFFVVQIPGGSWLVIAAFLGLLPTGIDVSLQASEWGKAKRAGMGAIRQTLEKEGKGAHIRPVPLGQRRPHRGHRSALSPRAGILPPMVSYRIVGLPCGARNLVLPRLYLPVACRSVVVPQPRGRERRHWRDRAGLQRQRRTGNDDRVHDRRIRGDVFDSLQLLRRVASRRRCLLSQPLPVHGRAPGGFRRAVGNRAPTAMVFRVQHLSG